MRRPALLGVIGGLLGLAVLVASGCRPASSEQPADRASRASEVEPGLSYDTLRQRYPTQLNRREPSTGSQQRPPLPDGATEVIVTSGELSLLAWLALPPGASATEPVPGLVYFHGDFSLSAKDWRVVGPVLDAGFAVLLPSLRGENGNPGDLELLAGEVDDGVAAIATLAAHQAVDATRIYAIGHSVGGALAALVSLRPDAGVVMTGSVGGIYVPDTFVRWAKMSANRGLVRFDPTDPVERRLRSLLPNVTDLVVPHHAYIGDDDRWFHDNAAAVAEAAARANVERFVVHHVTGDHATSLRPGLAAFVALAAADASPAAP